MAMVATDVGMVAMAMVATVVVMEAMAVDTTARGLLMLSPRLRLDTAAMAMAVGMGYRRGGYGYYGK